MLNLPYPSSPSIADLSFLKPKASFISQVWQVAAAILLFVIVYIALIAGATGLVYLCFKFSILMLGVSANKITVILAIGLIALSVMFFAFLVKFVFASKTHDTSGSIEILEQEHPKLFAFINRLTEELQAPKPKKIFLLPDVNASVFYNSSFWSMFLPVRKNLNIGLGFVNTVNLSEFKAVLAHEFGHFSQKSMKLGSYVYTVNHVIYNLVFEYDKWDEMLQRWAAQDGLFSFFAVVTEWLVNLVRRLLAFMYSIINKRNMSLSREMEYNADLFAVSAAGGNAMVSALRRVGFGSAAYQDAISCLDKELGNQKKTDNFYDLHTAMLHRLARLNDISLSHNLPDITDQHINKAVSRGRVVFKDQWASHPEQEDREANINSVKVQADIDNGSPWQLFEQPAKLQARMTEFIYRHIPDAEQCAVLPTQAFIQSVEQRAERFKLPEKFNGFYDNRILMDFDQKEALRRYPAGLRFEDVFSDENAQKIKEYFANHQDRNLLENIHSGSIDTKTFDFDGVKYKKDAAEELLAGLDKEIEQQKQWFKDVEEQAFSYHYHLAEQKGQSKPLMERYETYDLLVKEQKILQPLMDEANGYLHQLQVTRRWSEDDSMRLISNVYNLRQRIQDTIARGAQFRLPVPIGDYDPSMEWPSYLLPEELAFVSNHTFNAPNFSKMYEQLAEAHSKIGQLCYEALLEVLRFQEGLAK